MCKSLTYTCSSSHKHSRSSNTILFNQQSQPQSTRRDGLGQAKGYSNTKARYILEHGVKSGLPDTSKPFTVLGIESSCDDTGVAIVRSDGTILSNIVYSQHTIHEKFGGVVPSLAMEEHKNNIDKAIAEALAAAGLASIHDVDAIAVTKGPGLEICLRVGLRKAQLLAKVINKPFVTVHHLEAHCLIARLCGNKIVSTGDGHVQSSSVSEQEMPSSPAASPASVASTFHNFTPKISYPFLALLASGGHTSLLLCRSMGEYEVLGGTLDDALGEAFDKAARLLGLKLNGNNSGGAAVEVTARSGKINPDFLMTVPMRDKINCDFSYAGLKNGFRVAVQKVREANGLDAETKNAPLRQMEVSPEMITLPDDVTADLCATFQHVAFTHVEDRLKRALNYVEDNNIDISSLVVVGGVASNVELRRRLLKTISTDRQKAIDLVFPPVSLCTDNGVMAAWAGIEKLSLGISDSVDEQEVIARWPLGMQIINPVYKKREKI